MCTSLDKRPDLHYFVFREAESSAETSILLHLLSDVYESSGLAHMAPRENGRIVYDRYDINSTYFGVYKAEVANERPVGCLRVVHGDRFDESDSTPLPMLKYFPDADVVRQFLAEQRTAGRTFTETGRMALLEEYRNAGLLEFIVDAVAAWGFLNGGVDVALTCPWPALQRIYKRVGFRKISGTKAHRLDQLGIQACSLFTTWSQVPEHRKPALRYLSSMLTKHGRICYDPIAGEIATDTRESTEQITVAA